MSLLLSRTIPNCVICFNRKLTRLCKKVYYFGVGFVPGQLGYQSALSMSFKPYRLTSTLKFSGVELHVSLGN